MKRTLVVVGIIVLLLMAYVALQGVVATDSPLTDRTPAETYEFTMDDGGTFTVTYADEYKTAVLEFGGDTYDLSRAVSASGARYESSDGDVVFWEQSGEAMIEIDGEMVVSGALPVTDDEGDAVGETGIQAFTVAPAREACTGVGPRECLVVNGELFYDRIAGFTFEPGYEYQLLVNKTRREGDVPADASEFEYTLIEEVRKTPVVAPANEPNLLGNRWQWLETNYDNGDSVVPAEPTAFTLSFSESGQVAIRTDCNSGSGTIVTTDGQFAFSPIAMTKRACIGETQEQPFLEMLDLANGYSFNAAGQLELTLAPQAGSDSTNPAGVMVFRQDSE